MDHDTPEHHHGGEGRPVSAVEPTQPDHEYANHQSQLALTKAQIQVSKIGRFVWEEIENWLLQEDFSDIKRTVDTRNHHVIAKKKGSVA